MKTSYQGLLAILLSSICLACSDAQSAEDQNQESSTIVSKITETSATSSLSAVEKSMKELEAQIELLKSSRPVEKETLKACFPTNILGLNRSSLEAAEGMALGIATAEAIYTSEDQEQEVQIHIMDGAGEQASAFAGLALLGYLADSEKITPNGFEKITDFHGKRARISETKEDDWQKASIEWYHNKRYQIRLKAEGLTLEQLAGFMDTLNLQALK